MNLITLSLTSILIGLACGSFLNVLVYRFRNELSIITPRSFCPSCEKTLKWYDNVPVISYIILQGNCRYCDSEISVRYLLVELWMAVAFLLVVFLGGHETFIIELVRDWLIIFVLTFIFIYDLKYKLILDKITLPVIVVLFIANVYFGWISATSMLIGAAVAGGFFLLQFLVSHGKWIGGGDIRLGILMGVILGWPDVILALFLAYILGALISIGLILFGDKKLASKTPFGVYLTVGTAVVMFFSEQIIDWYLNLILF